MLDSSDDYDFSAHNNSKLASLFGNVSNNSEPNNSLIYKAPKQPPLQESTPNVKNENKSNNSSETKTSVIIGKVVTLWKLNNNEYVGLGKHGIAVIGLSEKNIFEMIVYKEKTNVIVRIRINNDFTFYNQNDNFSTFYDSNSTNWLIKFEAQDQNEFTENLKNLNVKIVDSRNTNANDLGKMETKSASKPEVVQKPEVIHKQILQNVDQEHSDSSSSKQRANILNRMAKMGQSILPHPPSELKNTSTELSDSEVEETIQERRIPPKQIKKIASERYSKQLAANTGSDTRFSSNAHAKIEKYQPETLTNSQILPTQFYNPQMLPNQINHLNWSNDGYSQYIIAQNTELKVNLAQISAKLDSVLTGQKFVPDNDKNLTSKLKSMQLRVENLESELENSEKKYSVLQHKYNELERKMPNMVLVDSKSQEIEFLENTISDLKGKLYDANKINEEQTEELETKKQKLQQFGELIEKQQTQIKEHEMLLEQNQNVKELTQTVQCLNNTIDDLKQKLTEAEDNLQAELNKKPIEQTKTINVESLESIVKVHMNDMYQTILNNFEENGSYGYSDIQRCVAKNLKNTSFKIIQDCISKIKETTSDIHSPNK